MIREMPQVAALCAFIQAVCPSMPPVVVGIDSDTMIIEE
jgi:hypothetical protein